MTHSNHKIIVDSNFIKIGRIKSERYNVIEDPTSLINQIKQQDLKLDIFTFMQKIPDTNPLYDYPMEFDNVAALDVSTYDNWWNKQINAKTRNMVRKAIKLGVEVNVSEPDDDFIKGIVDINNETPVRQGRSYEHYGKTFEELKEAHLTYPERNCFIGAYYEGKLIGYMKIVFVRNYATIMQILSFLKYRDLAVNNALISEAVKVCADKKIPYLVYAKFTYGNKGEDPLAKFKKHNGFHQIDLPRYYIPLTLKGKVAFKLGIHNGVKSLIPQSLIRLLMNIRSALYRMQRD